MKVGTKVKVIKEFTKGIVDFEVGDILTVGNYIHNDGVCLKAEGIRDLIKVKFKDISEYLEEIKEPYPEFVQLIAECQARDWNISLTWQKINEWSIEIYTGYKSNYEEKYYTDGHMTKEVAIETALEFFEEFNKLIKG